VFPALAAEGARERHTDSKRFRCFTTCVLHACAIPRCGDDMNEGPLPRHGRLSRLSERPAGAGGRGARGGRGGRTSPSLARHLTLSACARMAASASAARHLMYTVGLSDGLRPYESRIERMTPTVSSIVCRGRAHAAQRGRGGRHMTHGDIRDVAPYSAGARWRRGRNAAAWPVKGRGSLNFADTLQ